MSKRKGSDNKTIGAFVVRKPSGSDSSPLAVTLLGQTACLTAHGFYGALAFWDGRFLNIPAPFGSKARHAWLAAREPEGDMARLLLRRVVTHLHGTAQWEAIEPVAPVFSEGARITWPARNGDALIRLPYPFVFDAKDLVIKAPDLQRAFLRARRHEEAYVRILRTLGGAITPTRKENIARKVYALRSRCEQGKRTVLPKGRGA